MNTEVIFARHPGKIFNLQRVNILLGANGTGKSKTLQELKTKSKTSFPGYTTIYVEGGRTIAISGSLKLTVQNFNTYQTLSQTEKSHKDKQAVSLSQRVFDCLLLLERKGQEIKEQHSDAISAWHASGQSGPIPIREEPPLDKLFNRFNEIFPSIKLAFDTQAKQILCYKNGGAKYLPSSLSDGEKQVISILADIAILASPRSLILVDEPELNLNPSLASRVWETIENDLPESIFVYTTHDVGFSMRSNVDKVFVLSNENENVSEIKNINDISPNDLRSLLGSIPAILSTNAAIITEGKPNSFDAIFYRWIIGNTAVETVPMGSGFDVVAVANRTGVWEAIAPSVKIKGIIDCDYKSEETLKNFESNTVIILEFHEAESYLCIPSLVKEVSEKMGLIPQPLSDIQIENIIIDEFKKNYLKITAQRVFDRTTVRLSVSMTRKELSEITDQTELEEKLISASKCQSDFAEEHLGEDKIREFFKEELNACENAIASRNIKQILKLNPGKNIIDKISRIAGAQNVSDYARACTKHINILDVEELKNLREKLLQ